MPRGADAHRSNQLTGGAVALSAAAICLCSFAAGHAVWRLAGFEKWSPLVGPLGLATLLVLCRVGIELPGRRTTAALIVLAVSAAGVALMARSVRFGDPLSFREAYDGVPPGRARREVTDLVMAAIQRLSGQELAGVYNERPAEH